MTDEARARADLVAAAHRLDVLGLNLNSSGNLSVRIGENLLVTPTGIPAEELTPGAMVLLAMDGTAVRPGERAPTSEWRLHTEIHRRRPDVNAIVHTHSPEATAAAVVGSSIPSYHYVVARFGGGGLACAPYATYGTADLAVAVSDQLGDSRFACLMANHGAIAVGTDLRSALALALDVEWFCGVVRRATDLGGAFALPRGEIEQVERLFASHGQPGSSGAEIETNANDPRNA